MLIDEIYDQLKFDGNCETAEQFSTEYLGKYENYYLILKLRRAPPDTETLTNLYTALANKALSLESNTYPYFVRMRKHLLNSCQKIHLHITQEISN